MKDGFLRVAAGTPIIRVADCEHNALEAVRLMKDACAMNAKVLVLPQLCLTGYTAGDLLRQRTLQQGAFSALEKIIKASKGIDMLTIVGLPLAVEGKLYDCAAAVSAGQLLAVVPKRQLSSAFESDEARWFAPGPREVRQIELLNAKVPFGGDILFTCPEMPDFRAGIEIGADLWAPGASADAHALAGATLLLSPAATCEIAGRASYRRRLLITQTRRLTCAVAYADAGDGESTTDLVFAGHDLIAEDGKILSASRRYECALVTADVDVGYLAQERMRQNSFPETGDQMTRVNVHWKMETLALDRFIDPSPFVPFDETARERRCEDILDMQAHGLMARLTHIGCKKAIIGVSGGLDSTLALLVTARAFERLGLPREGIIAVTMPCFGTTERTKSNAVKLAEGVGATLKEIGIGDSVLQHFKDIGHDEENRDVTYENSQARERTQVLMDLANQVGGLVVGTGDLSELALGWATYNGDHMSMYGVNAGVPKTLIRYLVRFVANHADEGALKEALEDVLGTPVSPELLPPKDGVISQVTEDLVGPYELHDFFLYHIVRRMDTPAKARRLALIAFEGTYPEQVVDKWLNVFLKRFFAQQFKRNCLPDGPKVGSVSVSPRGDWIMPSDACGILWQNDLKAGI